MKQFVHNKIVALVVLVLALVLGWIIYSPQENELSYQKLGLNINTVQPDQIKLLGNSFWITDYSQLYFFNLELNLITDEAILPEGFTKISIIDADKDQIILQSISDGTHTIYSTHYGKFFNLDEEVSTVYLNAGDMVITQKIEDQNKSSLFLTNFVTGISQKIGIWDEAYPISLLKVSENEFYLYSEPSELYNQPLYKLTIAPEKLEKYKDNFGFDMKMDLNGKWILLSRFDQNNEVKSILYDVKTKMEKDLNQSLDHYLSYFNEDKLIAISNINDKSYIMVYEGDQEVLRKLFGTDTIYSIAGYSENQAVIATKNKLKIIDLNK